MNKEESNQHKHEHVDHDVHESHNHLEHEHHEHHDHENHEHESHQHHDHHNHSEHEHHDHEGHDHGGGGHEHHHHGNFKELFLKSLPLEIIIIVLSPMMGVTLPFQFTFPYSDILVAIVSTILLVYGGKPFYQGAMDEFKQKAPGMMALVSLGVSVSYLYSIYAVVARYMTN